MLGNNSRMENILKIVSDISTPLILAGVIISVLYGLFKAIIMKSPEWYKKDSARIITILINWVAILALIAILLGFIGFIHQNNQTSKNEKTPYSKKPHIVEEKFSGDHKNFTLFFSIVNNTPENIIIYEIGLGSVIAWSHIDHHHASSHRVILNANINLRGCLKSN